MPSTTATVPAATHAEIARSWAPHLMCLVLPVTTLAFALSGPHGGWVAPLFLLPLLASVVADMNSPAETRQPPAEVPSWPFDAVLILLVVAQFVNVIATARLIGQTGLLSVDAFVAVGLVGINSGYSAIVVAHELVHRSSPRMQWLGRALLATVLYEHFATEHVRGHHARIGTDEDPATARFGEDFAPFWRRTIPAQFVSAWRLEEERLAREAVIGPRRWLRHRIVQGIVAGWGLAVVLAVVFGAAAFVVHVLQALLAVTALEAVNYFEHWGLRRRSRRVRPVDSWDTDSSFTLYTLVGLSRHADHHAYASRPYQTLRHWQESPKLPFGYFGMVFLVWARNDLVKRMLTKELRRKRLGPFAATTSVEAAAA